MDDGRSFEDRLAFLREIDGVAAGLLLRAAQQLHDDPSSGQWRCGFFGEVIAQGRLKPPGLRDRATFFEIIEARRQAPDGSPTNPAKLVSDALRWAVVKGAKRPKLHGGGAAVPTPCVGWWGRPLSRPSRALSDRPLPPRRTDSVSGRP